MTSCVVKWCKRRKEGSKKQTGITYHSFPKNEIRRSKWIAAVRLERREDDWLPSKASRVCSIHFENEDMYESRTGNRMLKKCAVPICTMVRTSNGDPQKKTLKKKCSLVQEKTECQKQMMHPKEEFPVSASEIITSNENPIQNISTYLQVQEQTIDVLGVNYLLPIEIMQIPHLETAQCEHEKEKERALAATPISIPSSDSDIESAFSSPREQYLKRQLRKKTLLAEKRRKIIKKLQRQNKRLIKRNITLKDVIKTFKNKGFANSTLHSSSSGFANDIDSTVHKK